MKKPLAALLVVAALIVAWQMFAAPSPAYVNLFDKCFNNRTYGTLIDNDTALYADESRLEAVARIPHGTPVLVIRDAGEVAYVEIEGQRGWIPSSLISDYNPAGGAQPDFSACA